MLTARGKRDQTTVTDAGSLEHRASRCDHRRSKRLELAGGGLGYSIILGLKATLQLPNDVSPVYVKRKTCNHAQYRAS